MIMDDHEFLSCGWLSGPGPNHEIVLSTRVRLARNVKGFPFSHWASTGELARLVSSCSAAIRKTSYFENAEEIHLEEVNVLDLAFLRERHQISAEMVHSQNQRSVFISADQKTAAMVAEEDHIRLQVLYPGLDLKNAWSVCTSLDDELSNHLTFAYSERLGYLTACPTNVGTGLRCSVMVHLPALVMTRQIQKMINAVSQLGMTVRGPSGEGSEIKGNLFQISNQITLGVNEDEIIERLSNLTEQIIDMETKATSQLLSEAEE
ncbi:MAG: ATP--guanido phosphotransferase, partial [Candidatus Omnitrophica bacterium]|nr:ATP--guanido phosphotransferase [Candidatus Omnitrophota bacterium]